MVAYFFVLDQPLLFSDSGFEKLPSGPDGLFVEYLLALGLLQYHGNTCVYLAIIIINFMSRA